MSIDVFSNIANQLDPTGILSTAVDNPDVLRTTGNSINLVLGQRTKFRASIAGVSYDAYATLKSAHLHRLSLIDHETRRGKTSALVTGIMKPVQMDIDIVIEGETMSIQEVLRRISMAQAKTTVSPEEFAMTLENVGLRFNTGMPIFFQHFGSDINEYRNLLEMFKAAGAENAYSRIKDPRNIKEAWQMPEIAPRTSKIGPEVVSFEVNRADRTQSQSYLPEQGLYGQGFLDFVDAIVENYKRVVSLRTQCDILTRDNASKAIAEGWSAERRQAAEEEVKALRTLSSQWATNWSGSQQRIIVNKQDSTDVRIENIYDPTALDCGKLTLAFGPETATFNLWTDSRASAEAVASTNDSSSTSNEPGSPVQWD